MLHSIGILFLEGIIEFLDVLTYLFPWYKKKNGKREKTFKNLTFVGQIGFGFIASMPVTILVLVTLAIIDTPAKGNRTKEIIREIRNSVEHYLQIYDSLPPNISIFITGNPLRKKWKRDEWGELILYRISDNGDTAIIRSTGKDKLANSSDDIHEYIINKSTTTTNAGNHYP